MALINVLDQYVYIMVYKDIPHPDECLERWRDVSMHVVCTGEWIDECIWMDGMSWSRVDGGMNGWMDDWLDGCLHCWME